jgi:hypothetical protein
VTFLFCHAIELYLKAYLRGAGSNLVELKKLGHRVSDLAKVAAEAGLVLEPHQSEVLSHDDADVAIEARYIVTGFKNLPTNEALSSVAELLDHVATPCASSGRPRPVATAPSSHAGYSRSAIPGRHCLRCPTSRAFEGNRHFVTWRSDSLAGHVGFEPANPCAPYLIGIA